MDRCQPSLSQMPNRRNRPNRIVMKDRKKSDNVGLSGRGPPDALPDPEGRHDL
jgi:hypothetical protein